MRVGALIDFSLVLEKPYVEIKGNGVEAGERMPLTVCR